MKTRTLEPLTKFKNLSDVDSILLGAAESDFQLVTQKKATKLRMTFKTFMEKNHRLLGKLVFENWPKCASVGCSRQGNQNIFILIFFRN